MLSAYLTDRRTAGTPDPAEVITVTLGGRTFQAGRRTAAHLQATIAAHPDLHVMQGCYHTGYAPSAGTHDFDGVLDVSIPSLSWPAAEAVLRRLGWAAWWRHTGDWAAESTWHVHMVSIGCPGPVGEYVPRQVTDYYANRDGLADHGPDYTPHPADIDSTIFDYPAWLTAQEDALPYLDWPQADKDAFVADVAKAMGGVLSAGLDTLGDRKILLDAQGKPTTLKVFSKTELSRSKPT